MDEKDWTIISTLFEEKNITKTADRLFITQPALTYRLQQIESELGVTMLHRRRQGVEFTTEGEMIAAYAKEMLVNLRNLKENLKSHGNQIKGTLRLGVTGAFAQSKLPKLLNDFSRFFPHIDFEITTGFSHDLIQALLKQELHVAIIRGNHNWPYERRNLAQENIYIFSNKRLDLDKLPDLPRIDYQTDPNLTKLIDDWWNERFTRPPFVSMKVDSMVVAKGMVQNDMGYTIAPSVLFEDDKPGDNQRICKLPLATNDGEPLWWKTSLFYSAEVLKLPPSYAFISYITNKAQV